jgi:outer membrane lipoprotein LolB
MTQRRAALAWLAALPLVAAGCATLSRPQETAPAAAGAESTRPEASRWSGRFAVTMIEPGVERREERASGQFTLETRDELTLLELASPLGQTMASAQVRKGFASLVTAEGRRYEADSAEELTERVFGWRVPVGDLPRWLRGNLEHPTENQNGRPRAGQYDGWLVRLDNWRDTGPGRLTLDWPARPQAEARRVNLKLIVDDVS